MPLHLPLIVAVVLASAKDPADLVAENLALRHQLSCLKHGRKRPMLRPVDRALWVLLSRFWGRRNELLVMVKPATVVAWHRKGFKLFWRWKSRRRAPGRPRITKDVHRLIVDMATTNVGWGAPRIHGEWLKLGIRISQSTVQRYMPRRKPSPESRQRWRTFLRNHVHESLAIDFAVVPSITFEVIYIFFVLSVDRRRILHFNVTKHPTAEWTAQQMVEACPFDTPGRFLFRDNDKIYGTHFANRVDGLGLTQVKTAFRSPWQNPFAERWIGGLRRDCLEHVIAVNERQLHRVIKSYIAYFHEDRTHLGLDKDTPFERRVDDGAGDVIAFPRVGGLHHRYARPQRKAAQTIERSNGEAQASNVVGIRRANPKIAVFVLVGESLDNHFRGLPNRIVRVSLFWSCRM